MRVNIASPLPRESTTTSSRWIRIYYAIANHLLWSALAVASRYLQVYATPQTFHGMTILTVTKASSFVLLFLYNRIVNTETTTPTSKRSDGSSSNNDTTTHDTSYRTSRHKRIWFALLYGVTSTCRACFNIASTKYTLSYNINTINSLSPLIIAIADAWILKTRLPWYLWPSISVSFFGCSLIALSQSPIFVHHFHDAHATTTGTYILSERDAIGCALQLASVLFSCVARLLMKVTEDILTRDEMVQVNNVFNTFVPMIYVFLADPHAWYAFAHMQIYSWLALGSIAILVYTIGSTTQMALIRSMGVGVYSSYSGVRVLGSVLLSSWILKEPVQNWLEWSGLAITTTTMTTYTIISSSIPKEKNNPIHPPHHFSKEINESLSTQDDESNETSDSFGSTAPDSELVELVPKRISVSPQSNMV